MGLFFPKRRGQVIGGGGKSGRLPRNSRRARAHAHNRLHGAVETLERRTMLAVVTLTNTPTPATVNGALYLTVDSAGTMDESFTPSAQLYNPFHGTKGLQDSVHFAETTFEAFTLDPAAEIHGGFRDAGIDYAISDFADNGFEITLTQRVLPVPTGGGTSKLVQRYDIKNVSNTTYNGVAFGVNRFHLSHMPWAGGNPDQDWAGLSGDGRVAIAFDSLQAGVFERIDFSGLDSTGKVVPDWHPSVVGITVPTNDATVSGDTNNDRLDDGAPAQPDIYLAPIELDASLTIPIGQTVTIIMTTGWGDTGTVAPVTYRKPGTFNLTAVTDSAPEGTSAVVRVSRTLGSLGHASVLVNNIEWFRTAVAGQDFDIVSGLEVILYDGETATGPNSQTPDPSFLVINDSKTEGNEELVVEIDTPNPANDPVGPPIIAYGAVLARDPLTINIDIPDNDFPSPFHFQVNNPATNQPWPTSFAEGAGATTIHVVRDGNLTTDPGPYGRIAVQYTITVPTTAGVTLGTDLIDQTPGTVFDATAKTYTGFLVFDEGVTAQDITLQVTDDSLVEPSEAFIITLSAATPVLIGTPNVFNGTITDNDATGKIGFLRTTDSDLEGAGTPPNPWTKTIDVTRANPTNSLVSVTYTITGGITAGLARPGVDFTVPGATLNGNTYTGTLTFAPGSNTPTTPLTILITNDGIEEPDESLTITLTDPGNAGILTSVSTLTYTIRNDDTPGHVFFTAPSYQISEGPEFIEPGTNRPYRLVTLQVTRDPNRGSQGAASVQYTLTNGSATGGTDGSTASADYQLLAGTQTLSWADGETGTREITVRVYDDVEQEGDETFFVSLSNGGTLSLDAPSSVTVTIRDNDRTGINFSADQVVAYEKDPLTGAKRDAKIVVQRGLAPGAPATAWSFNYVLIPGTATSGADFDPGTIVTVNVPANQDTYTITIPVTDDALVEGNETFGLRLLPATGSPLGTLVTTTVTITDDDASLQVEPAVVNINPATGKGSVTITRSGRTDSAVRVAFQLVDGTAKAGVDFTPPQATFVDFLPGETTKAIEFPVAYTPGVNAETKTFTFQLLSVSDVPGQATNASLGITPRLGQTGAAGTVNISGQVRATSLTLSGPSAKVSRIERLTVGFTDALDEAGAENTFNYMLTTARGNGRFSSRLGIASAVYNADDHTVTLFPAKPLPLNKLYQLSIFTTGSFRSTSGQPYATGTLGGLGGSEVAVFGRGAKIKYSDVSGDLVSLQMKKGGLVDYVDRLNGSNARLNVMGLAGQSVLTGVVKKVADGLTTIDQLTGSATAQILLSNPPFSVRAIS